MRGVRVSACGACGISETCHTYTSKGTPEMSQRVYLRWHCNIVTCFPFQIPAGRSCVGVASDGLGRAASAVRDMPGVPCNHRRRRYSKSRIITGPIADVPARPPASDRRPLHHPRSPPRRHCCPCHRRCSRGQPAPRRDTRETAPASGTRTCTRTCTFTRTCTHTCTRTRTRTRTRNLEALAQNVLLEALVQNVQD